VSAEKDMTEAKIEIIDIDKGAEAVLVNLLELYLHDMAEWFKFDINQDGLYGYDLGPRWARGDVAHLLLVDDTPAGFALIARPDEWMEDKNALEIEEFFLIRSQRHKGIGDRFATTLWDKQPGPWLIRVFEANLPGVPFWRRVISNYTKGTHEEERRLVNENAWRSFTFDNSVQND
jgi:predicted acetyltransferase